MKNKVQSTQGKSINTPPRSKNVLFSQTGKKVSKALPRLLPKRTNSVMKINMTKSKTDLGDLNFSQIVDTAKDVLTTGSRLIAGDPTSLLSVPNTILKVVDTVNSTTKALSTSNAPKVVVQKSDVSSLQNAKIINELKKTAPVINTSSIPSTFSHDIDLPAMKTTERVELGTRVFNVSGSSMLAAPIQFPFINPATFTKTYYSLINPIDNSFFGHRVEQFAYQFQKWRLNSCVATYIPALNTSVSGQVHLTLMNGTSITDPATTKTDIAQREHYKPSSVYTGNQLAWKGPGGFLWCSRLTSSTEQIKFFCAQQFEIWTDGNTQTDYPGPIGNVMFTFDIDFIHAAEYPYSFFSTIERKLQGHWLTNYINLDYQNHMKLLQLLIFKLRKEMASKKYEYIKTDSKLSLIHSERFTNFHISVIKIALFDYFHDIFNNTSILKCIVEASSNKNYSYTSELLKMVKKSYFHWLINFAVVGCLENALVTFRKSVNTRYSLLHEETQEEAPLVHELMDYLLNYVSGVINFSADKLHPDEFNLDDEILDLLEEIESDVDELTVGDN